MYMYIYFSGNNGACASEESPCRSNTSSANNTPQSFPHRRTPYGRYEMGRNESTPEQWNDAIQKLQAQIDTLEVLVLKYREQQVDLDQRMTRTENKIELPTAGESTLVLRPTKNPIPPSVVRDLELTPMDAVKVIIIYKHIYIYVFHIQYHILCKYNQYTCTCI